MSKAIITFIVLSLLGLIIIQAYMLRIGHTTESEKYDAEVSAIMYNISTDLFENTQLSRNIAKLSQEADFDKRTIFNNDSLPFHTVKEIDTLFKEQLAARGISVDYAFALTDEKNQLILNSPNFDANRFKFNRYARPLGLVKIICDCEVLIHFYQKNLNTYLFGQLAFLLIPSFLFLLMIIAGFSLLIYTINKQKRLLVIKNDFINNLTHELKTPVFSISLNDRIMPMSYLSVLMLLILTMVPIRRTGSEPLVIGILNCTLVPTDMGSLFSKRIPPMAISLLVPESVRVRLKPSFFTFIARLNLIRMKRRLSSLKSEIQFLPAPFAL